LQAFNEIFLNAASGDIEQKITDVDKAHGTGKGEKHIDMHGLASGTYMLRVTYPADPSYPRMTRVVVKE